jgi:hypothetical protein
MVAREPAAQGLTADDVELLVESLVLGRYVNHDLGLLPAGRSP